VTAVKTDSQQTHLRGSALPGGLTSASTDPSIEVKRIRTRYEILIWKLKVGWNQAASTGNCDSTLSGKQQLILRNLVIEMAVELGHAEGRELLPRSRSPEQCESDLFNLLESTASNAVARWRSFTGRCQLRQAARLSRLEGEIRKRVIDHLTPVAESLVLEAWSAYEARLEAERCPEAPQTTDLETAAACSQAVPITGPPNQKAGDLRNENCVIGQASSEASSVGAFEGLSDGTPGRGNSDSEERGAERRAFVMPKLASRGWTRGKWVAAAGVGKNCVYEYLRGVRQLGAENRRALAEALGVRVEDLPE